MSEASFEVQGAGPLGLSPWDWDWTGPLGLDWPPGTVCQDPPRFLVMMMMVIVMVNVNLTPRWVLT